MKPTLHPYTRTIVRTTAKIVLENIHQVSKVDVVNSKGLVPEVPWQKWAVESGAAVVAHVVYEGTSFEPFLWRANFIEFQNLELGQ